jgi:hypothetical protein
MARHTLLRVGVLLLALAHATASQRPPLEQVVTASYSAEVNALNDDTRGAASERLCFDAAQTLCLCRAPKELADKLNGGRVLWVQDGSMFNEDETKSRVPSAGAGCG